MNLNPIFQNEQTNKINPRISKRKTRSDKIHDIKFPITPVIRSEIRRRAKAEGFPNETKYCTHLLIQALKYDKSFFPEIKYTDTKTYIHVKPTEFYYDKIFELKVDWDLRSDRQTVHRLIMGMIRGNLS
ncbi:MAG: hypothetical protein ACH0QD_04610 [Tepidibacillus sp.]